MNLPSRARVHAALGDPHRLSMVDELLLGDRTFQDLMERTGLRGNLAAHHLDVLESAGLIERRVSEGDRRRRYIGLRHEGLEGLVPVAPVPHGPLLFVCTHNSARSQFAAAFWRIRTGGDADSAGTEPARAVHPGAVRAARAWGIDLRGALPKGYDAVAGTPGLVISVCDRARESGPTFDAPIVHWSIPDPVRSGRPAAFRAAFGAIAARIDHLAGTESRSTEGTRP